MTTPTDEPRTPTPEQAFADPCLSYALKRALREALARDPVDAWSDAELLARILKRRAERIRDHCERLTRRDDGGPPLSPSRVAGHATPGEKRQAREAWAAGAL